MPLRPGTVDSCHSFSWQLGPTRQRGFTRTRAAWAGRTPPYTAQTYLVTATLAQDDLPKSDQVSLCDLREQENSILSRRKDRDPGEI